MVVMMIVVMIIMMMDENGDYDNYGRMLIMGAADHHDASHGDDGDGDDE